MKILNFGSLNYDHVYQVDHFVQPKETMSSLSYGRNFGGKGLNQSIALAKAGCDVYHAGRVGSDGQDFIDYLNRYGVKTEYLLKDMNEATGHAIIEVCNGQNCIILHGGANQKVSEAQADEVLEHFGEGDLILLQNEISSTAYIMKKAHERGLKIAINTAPMDEKIFTYPLELVDIFIVNEVEAAGLVQSDTQDIDKIIELIKDRYSDREVVMTVGENGSYYIGKGEVIHEPAIRVDVVDTTAAGDTFTGFFLASYLKDGDVRKALKLATKASSVTVQGEGAAQSIPNIGDLQ
ncbi:MAG: ribokinase [Erysipelotrichaceae bacterium]|nr:ribokinase [Erysipelotrichaceae bacterium]